MARDDFDDRPYRGPAELTGLDKFFANTPVAIILSIVFFFCCAIAGVGLGIAGVATCKNPDSKRNATIMLALGALAIVLNIVLYATGVLKLPAQ
jgi:hypothetical protein